MPRCGDVAHVNPRGGHEPRPVWSVGVRPRYDSAGAIENAPVSETLARGFSVLVVVRPLLKTRGFGYRLVPNDSVRLLLARRPVET